MDVCVRVRVYKQFNPSEEEMKIPFPHALTN